MSPWQLVFVPGWGLGPDFWEPLRREMSGFPSMALDMGYFGPARLDIPNLTGPVAAVGHSLGVLWLMHENPFPFQALVSLGGFPLFTARPDFPAGMAPAAVRAMRRQLAKDPHATLRTFLIQCGLEDHPFQNLDRADPERLAQGLDHLLGWDAREWLKNPHPPMLALAAADDRVVPLELSRSAFGTLGKDLIILPSGGHGFPLNQAKSCAGYLRDFLNQTPC